MSENQAQHSADGRWWWDGSQWLPVAGPTVGSHPRWARPFASGRGRAILACCVLGAYAVGVVPLIVVTYFFTQYIDTLAPGARLAAGDVAYYETTRAWLLLARDLFALANLVTFPLWLHRACRNLPSLGATGLRFSPLLAVIFCFIPLANLVLVPLAVRELFQATDPDLPQNDRGSRSRTPVWRGIWVWWLAMIAFFLVLVVVNVLGYLIGSLGDMYNYLWLGIVDEVIGLVAALAAILVVLGIDWRQRERHRRLAESAAITPSA